MRSLNPIAIHLLLTLIILGSACSDTNDNSSVNAYNYTPDDQKLHDTIVRLDSIFFDAYNTCETNLDKHASFYSDSLEFYHDKGAYLPQNKKLLMQSEIMYAER